jgi:glucose dehydrogenase
MPHRKVPRSFAIVCAASWLQFHGTSALAQPGSPLQVPSNPSATAAQPDRDDGQWLMPAKGYANTRYSALDQINTGNVKGLWLGFTFSTGVPRGHEAAPLVAGNTMYIVTPYPNILYVLDLIRPCAPMKWQYQPKPFGQPISYRGPDGKQYIAILSGVGGWSGAIVAGNLDPRDGTGALDFTNAMKDLPEHTTQGGMLYVFALP